MKAAIIASTPNALQVAFSAIRTCYSNKNFDEIWNVEWQKYVDKNNDHIRLVKHIVNHGHCHDENTEVLTNRGYVLFKELLVSDLIAQFNNEGVFTGFTSDYNFIKQEYSGPVYTSESQTVNFKVTEDHKFIFGTRNATGMRVDTIKNLYNRKEFRIPTVSQKTINYTNQFTPNQLKLFGFFIGDGFRDKDNSKFLFHISKERKIDYLKSLGFEDLHIRPKGDGTFYCSVGNQGIHPDLFYTDDKEKTIPHVLFSENIEYLLDGMINSDGHISKTNTLLYDTRSKSLEAILSLLLTIHGINFRLSNAESYKENAHYRFTIVKSNSLPFVKDARHTKDRLIRTDETLTIYSVETPGRFIATRRKGIPMISGNSSTLEHITFTFSLEGVSRACLAQLTRHRLASYSVRSQRYIKGVNWAEGVSEVEKHPMVQDHLKRVEELYDALLASGFKAEDARMILPNQAATNIIMTINLRSFMNLYSLRKPGTHSQAEIGNLVEMMKNEIVRVEPWIEELL